MGILTLDSPVFLFDENNRHRIFWVGSVENSLFRCNSYLLQDGAQNYLIDPGGLIIHFPQVMERIKAIILGLRDAFLERITLQAIKGHKGIFKKYKGY
ncbi:MAG: hypothetical protein HY265_08930 [Deltaproteobacteria bacterium]|nr:hypothetical protein [Deltaproteobacteria bacterium]